MSKQKQAELDRSPVNRSILFPQGRSHGDEEEGWEVGNVKGGCEKEKKKKNRHSSFHDCEVEGFPNLFLIFWGRRFLTAPPTTFAATAPVLPSAGSTATGSLSPAGLPQSSPSQPGSPGSPTTPRPFFT